MKKSENQLRSPHRHDKAFYLYGFVLLLWGGLCPLFLVAQNTEKWWMQSSLADSVSQLQIHASAKYSYTRMKGVISGHMINGNMMLVLRKGVFSHFTRYGADKYDLNLKSSLQLKYATKARYVTDYVNIDITKTIFTEGGFIWEMDDALLLQNRYTFYGGIGLTTAFFKKLKCKTLFASGRINQDYTIPVDNLSVIKKPYAAFYGVNDFDYPFSPTTSASGKIYYFTDLDDLTRYRYGYILNLSLSLWKHISLVAGYQYKYDRELKLLGLMPDNIVQTVGIEVSF